MANNKLNQNENIAVLLDQQNIVHIDPNTVISSDGELQPRLVDHENLVMYVNLEADLVPRSVLYAEAQGTSYTSIAEGSFKLLRNQGDTNPFENNFDTNWTDTFVSNNKVGVNRTTGENTTYDPSAQTFGIESISMTTTGINNIPQVNINFVDVRGKTLFDSPDNSPYKAFFHQPWPIFYLTIKGFYGKAARYRLQLLDFKSKFNGNTGNFEITTKFSGSSYAFLNDVLFQNIVNAPFMYMVDTTEPYKVNEKKNIVEKKVSKTTKGYAILKSVYDEYKSNGYIPKDFPVKTLRDLLMTATALETIIEKSLFAETVDASVLSDVAQYDKTLDKFEKSITLWGAKHLNANDPVDTESIQFFDSTSTVTYHNLNKTTSDQNKTTNGPVSLDIVTGTTNSASLQYRIDYYINELEKNLAFGKSAKAKDKIDTRPISLDSLKNIKDFYTLKGEKIGVSIEKLVSVIKGIQATFIKKRDSVEMQVEAKMNEIIKNKEYGFGFEPTIRNIFAVILANADTYIRLMKDVHNTVIRRAEDRKTKLGSKGKKDSDKNEVIYPWPDIKKDDKEGKSTYYYPGDSDVIGVTKGNDYGLWPEVEFVETYNSVAVKRIDPGTAKEVSPSDVLFVFDGNDETADKYDVSTALNTAEISAYSNKSISNFIYEIYERAKIITSYETFEYGTSASPGGLGDIVDAEFKNISGTTQYDLDLKNILTQDIKTTEGLISHLYKVSPIERYPYYQDSLTTVDYIKTIVDKDFLISQYDGVSYTANTTNNEYTKLQDNIKSYSIPEYRVNEFPFNSELFSLQRSYKENIVSQFKVFGVSKNKNFISSPIKPIAWIKDGADKNLFTNQFTYSGLTRNILNTPYFHKQLYSDFFKGGIEGRYVGSAYLLLNSLPYKELDDVLNFDEGKITMYDLFKEIGATHYVPHHLLLKWGAVYHRYKKYLLEGVDILSGVTTPINVSNFFDNGSGSAFNLSGNTKTNTITGATFASSIYVGLYPYYHGIYSQVVNGYSFYNPSGFTKTSADAANAASEYAAAVSSGITQYVTSKPTADSGVTFTCLVDNSKFTSADNRFTLLPSYNGLQINKIVGVYNNLIQDSFRIIYDTNDLNKNPQYSSASFPGYGEKFENYAGLFSLDGSKKQINDLIATFSPKFLDELEKMFIEFASLDLDLDTKKENQTDYSSFQKLLKEITSISKDGIDFTGNDYAVKIKENQTKKLEQLSINLLDSKLLNKVSIGNPRQIDNYIFDGYLKHTTTYSVNGFDSTQLTTQNRNLIDLYIGKNLPIQTAGGTIANPYYLFFEVSDIEVSPENIYSHREIARIFAGWLAMSSKLTSIDYTQFKTYFDNSYYIPKERRLFDFLNNLTGKLSTIEVNNKNNNVTIYHGYNESKTTLLDLYQFFKSFNDKWIAGNAIGQRSLMEEFLFLDRANRDIGDKAYISLDRLISLGDEKNIKIDLFSAIVTLLEGTNFDIRPMPSYVNFYGTNSSNKKRILPAKNIARTLFGTFLDVDYQESSPKIIIQYINKASQYLDMANVSKEYKFKNDGFDIKDPNANPLLIEPKIFMDADLSKSNRVVSFEVNFGDQSQNLFKNISLDQSTYKNTTESAYAQERLARAQGGGGSHAVDIGLFDIYKSYSYQCTVTCMGNAMIQPTMYFYLANVPMFSGTYLVFNVSHSIKQGGFETTFTGVRISNSSLPSLESSFMSSYRPLFSRILSAAVKKKQELDKAKEVTTQTFTTKDNKTFTVDPGVVSSKENLVIAKESGFLFDDLIPYNGQLINGKPEQYIQLVEFEGEKWLRTRVCVLGAGKYTPTGELSLVSGWKAYPNKMVRLENINDLFEYYSIRCNVTNGNREKLFSHNTIFYNPSNKERYKLTTSVNPNTGEFDGPVHNGPSITDTTYGQYGLALSPTLMRKLKLAEGDVVYISYTK